MQENHRTMDLNHLIDLDALLSEGSVAGAAKKLHLSAPAMSRRLAHLRHALGDPLFVLAGRRLVPTARALDLRERVQAAMEDVRGILAPPVVDFSRLERTLTLRANDGFIGAWAPRLLARTLAEAPGVRLRFVPRTDTHMEQLRSGEIDLDLGVLHAPAPEIKSQLLMRVGFVGVVRAGHALQQLATVDVAAFTHWPHVTPSRRGRAHGSIDEALQAVGAQRQVVAVVPGFQTALAMVQASDCIAVMPEPFARWNAGADQFFIFALPVATQAVDIALSWHPRMHGDPVHCWLREHVRAVTASAWPAEIYKK
jgi:DNA-binding transcriptional LysR family regulator